MHLSGLTEVDTVDFAMSDRGVSVSDQRPGRTLLDGFLVFLFAMGTGLMMYDLLLASMLVLGWLASVERVAGIYRDAHGGSDAPAAVLAVLVGRAALRGLMALGAVWLRLGHRWARGLTVAVLVANVLAYAAVAGTAATARPEWANHFNLTFWFWVAAIQLLALVVVGHESTRALLCPPARTPSGARGHEL